MLRVTRSLALLYVVWCGVLFVLQPSMLYLPVLAGTGLTKAEIDERVEQGTLERHWIERDGARANNYAEREWLAKAEATRKIAAGIVIVAALAPRDDRTCEARSY